MVSFKKKLGLQVPIGQIRVFFGSVWRKILKAPMKKRREVMFRPARSVLIGLPLLLTQCSARNLAPQIHRMR